jgi:hypothetical protein
MDAEEYATFVRLAMRHYDDTRDRSLQTKDYRLGVSDLGGCHNYAALLTKQTPFSDSPSRGAAMLGTFIHAGVAEAMRHADPDLLIEHEVEITLPNGVELLGHADRIDRAENSVTDDKTVDRLGDVRRAGPTQQQEWQVTLYALGAVQQGLLDGAKPITCRLVWWDRSGKDDLPHVWQTTYPTMADLERAVQPAVEWLDDVIYAVKEGEDASRDKPVDWCASSCPYYSVCRVADLPEVEELITDESVVRAVESYRAGLELAKEADSLKESGKSVFDGISGMVRTEDGSTFRLRWITIAGKTVKEHERLPYRRLDLREVSGQ